MTVCIGAICDKGKTIVMAMDMLLSLGFTSAEFGLKTTRIHERWFAMFAGNDISAVPPVLDGVRQSLSGRTLMVQDVEMAFEESYQKEWRSRVENSVLSQYGLTMESFVKGGLQSFGNVGFDEIRRRIEKTDLECDFLIVGFDNSDTAYIFTVENPGIAIRNLMDCWAIGSGGTNALSILSFHDYNGSYTFPMCVYHVCEAKFMAEKALGVGRETLVFAVKSNGDYSSLGGDDLSELRKLWEEHGRPRFPKNVTGTVTGLVTWKSLP